MSAKLITLIVLSCVFGGGTLVAFGYAIGYVVGHRDWKEYR